MGTKAISIIDEFDRYMAHISQFPILSPEAEIRLAIRWRDHGDVEAAHTLVMSNLRFVVKIANEYRGYGARILDLVQEGSVGLMRAVKGFDPRLGYRLLSYAVYWIRAEIHLFLMRSLRVVKIGGARTHRKLFFKLRAIKGRLAARGIDDRELVLDAVAEETGVERAVVDEVDRGLCAKEVSIDAPVGPSKTALVSILPDDGLNPEELVANLETQAALPARIEAAMETLSPREREIIVHRYLREKPEQLKAIGARWGVSKQRAHQLERRALKKLRCALTGAT